MTTIALTKPAIFAAHLDAAFHLVALDDAYVSAHVVIMAAEEIFRTWYVKKNVYWPYDYRILIKDEHHSVWLQMIREKYNFFKHADRDIDGAIDVEPEELHTANQLMGILIAGYNEVFSSLTPTMKCFSSWFIAKFPDLLKSDLPGRDAFLAILEKIPSLGPTQSRMALRALFYKQGVLPRTDLVLMR
ncbi:hypothetical protein [Bradyrhizobium sp. USDA 4506]